MALAGAAKVAAKAKATRPLPILKKDFLRIGFLVSLVNFIKLRPYYTTKEKEQQTSLGFKP